MYNGGTGEWMFTTCGPGDISHMSVVTPDGTFPIYEFPPDVLTTEAKP